MPFTCRHDITTRHEMRGSIIALLAPVSSDAAETATKRRTMVASRFHERSCAKNSALAAAFCRGASDVSRFFDAADDILPSKAISPSYFMSARGRHAFARRCSPYKRAARSRQDKRRPLYFRRRFSRWSFTAAHAIFPRRIYATHGRYCWRLHFTPTYILPAACARQSGHFRRQCRLGQEITYIYYPI